MHESYEAWLADYHMAVEQGRDSRGRDQFDLLMEKMHEAEVWLWFEGSFSSEGEANEALRAFEAMGYKKEVFIHPSPETPPDKRRWILEVGRSFQITTAEAFRDEVSAGSGLLDRFDAYDDWNFWPLEGHPGTGPPI
jgi:hypothetical protein